MTLDFPPLRPYIPYEVPQEEQVREQYALDLGRERALKWLTERGIVPAEPYTPWRGVPKP